MNNPLPQQGTQPSSNGSRRSVRHSNTRRGAKTFYKHTNIEEGDEPS